MSNYKAELAIWKDKLIQATAKAQALKPGGTMDIDIAERDLHILEGKKVYLEKKMANLNKKISMLSNLKK